MNNAVKRIGVLTSGGDAPGMNACIRAVVRSALARGIECVGIRRGYAGLISGDIMEMNSASVSRIINRGGTILYSARCEEFRTQEGQQKAANTCKLLGLDVRSLTMAQESLAEAIRPKQWYNPFPKVRYTERPDAAAASIMEGSIVLMVDNSPSVMILPTGFFDFTQESNDYYFPPLVGTYLRVLRVTVFLLSLFITPAWYLMVSEPNRLPGWLNFLSSPEPVSLSLLSQLLVVEFLIDVLKLASLNTPDSLSNSFSMLGALVLGDFAVQAGWLGPEVLVYMAFVSVAGFAQPSYELGYAFKLLRVALLLVTAAFDVWGFCLGVVGIFILLCTTKPLVGKGYLYPLVPFNGKALLRLLVREPISRDNT